MTSLSLVHIHIKTIGIQLQTGIQVIIDRYVHEKNIARNPGLMVSRLYRLAVTWPWATCHPYILP